MKKLLSYDFASVTSVKRSVKGGKSVFIEGFANRFSNGEKLLIDRGSDLIEPGGWKLENFQNNPIIFFNHDRNKPIGQAIRSEITSEGLKIKVKLSDSNDPEISRIRDLVSEGILKSFSVGFDPRKIESQTIDGKEISIIKEAELLEVSVVSIPMAEHSLFNVTVKHLSAMPYDEAKRICLLGKASSENAQAAEDDPDEEEEAPVKVEGPMLEITSQPSEAQASNPTIDAIRQTNILLAQLIAATQLVGMKVEEAFKEPAAEEEPAEEEPAEEEPEEEEPEEEEPKHFDPDQVKTLSDYLIRAEAILKNHRL